MPHKYGKPGEVPVKLCENMPFFELYWTSGLSFSSLPLACCYFNHLVYHFMSESSTFSIGSRDVIIDSH